MDSQDSELAQATNSANIIFTLVTNAAFALPFFARYLNATPAAATQNVLVPTSVIGDPSNIFEPNGRPEENTTTIRQENQPDPEPAPGTLTSEDTPNANTFPRRERPRREPITPETRRVIQAQISNGELLNPQENNARVPRIISPSPARTV